VAPARRPQDRGDGGIRHTLPGAPHSPPHTRTSQSAQADFVCLLQRIHSPGQSRGFHDHDRASTPGTGAPAEPVPTSIRRQPLPSAAHPPTRASPSPLREGLVPLRVVSAAAFRLPLPAIASKHADLFRKVDPASLPGGSPVPSVPTHPARQAMTVSPSRRSGRSPLPATRWIPRVPPTGHHARRRPRRPDRPCFRASSQRAAAY
jgi:hypothetical protein